MSQFSYTIPNEAGAAFRADANSALQALASNNSGTAAPSTTFGNMLWADTTAALLKKRNNANAAWVTFADKDLQHLLMDDGTVGAPSFSFNLDTDSGLYRIGANNLGIGVNGAKVLDIGTAGLGVTGTLSASGASTFTGTVTLGGNLLGAGNTAAAYTLGTNTDLLGGGRIQLYGGAAGDKVNILGGSLTYSFDGTGFLAGGIAALAGAALSASTAINLPAGTTALSSFRAAHGAAPTSPVNGDFWTTTAGAFIRINGVTKTFTLT